MLSAGYLIGIYPKGRNGLAVIKRGVWALNHPQAVTPDNIESNLVTRAIDKANELYTQYITGQLNK